MFCCRHKVVIHKFQDYKKSTFFVLGFLFVIRSSLTSLIFQPLFSCPFCPGKWASPGGFDVNEKEKTNLSRDVHTKDRYVEHKHKKTNMSKDVHTQTQKIKSLFISSRTSFSASEPMTVGQKRTLYSIYRVLFYPTVIGLFGNRRK